jgi:hypothetical protein
MVEYKAGMLSKKELVAQGQDMIDWI